MNSIYYQHKDLDSDEDPTNAEENETSSSHMRLS